MPETIAPHTINSVTQLEALYGRRAKRLTPHYREWPSRVAKTPG